MMRRRPSCSAFSVIACLVLLGRGLSFSREARSVQVFYEGTTISIDLATRSLQDSVENLCSQAQCDVPSTIASIETYFDNSAHEAVEGAYLSLIERYSKLESPNHRATDWRAQTFDPTVSRNHYETQLESKHLLTGIFKPRTSCITDPQNPQYTQNNYKTCTFTRILSNYHIYPPIPLAKLTYGQWGYMFDLADDLFNNQLYDHAEAWCHYLVHHLLTPPPLHVLHSLDTSDTTSSIPIDTPTSTPFSLTSLSTYQHLLLCRGSLQLSEISRLQSHLSLATYHSMRVLRSYNTLLALSLHNTIPFFNPVPNVGLLSRLRVLLTIPPTPPNYSEALQNRREMIHDLGVFVQDILKHNLTLSLQALSSHVSAMPFNMAHQGINDLDMQQTLHTVLTTLCPELEYTAPHLGSGDDNSSASASDSSRTGDIGGSYSSSRDSSSTCTQYNETNHCTHRTLKVGFLSTNFFDHSIGRILASLLIQLPHMSVVMDSEYYTLEVFVFTIDRRVPHDASITIHTTSITPTTDTTHTTNTTHTTPSTHSIHIEHDPTTLANLYHDAVTRILHDYLPNRSIRLPDNIHTIRTVLAAAQLDVLVFTDVGMDFASYQVAFGRYAPIQAAWWGHPITAALPSIDYFITLDQEVRSAHSHYSEQVVRMKYINTVPLASPYNTRLLSVQRMHDRSSGDSGSSNSVDGTTNSDVTAHNAEVQQQVESDLHTLKQLGLTNSDIVMVLGRLFKLHPAFDEMLTTLLLDLYAWDSDIESSSGRDGRDGSNDGSASTYIVLIAESVHELNEIILARLIRTIDARISTITTAASTTTTSTTAHKLVSKYIRLVGYSHYFAVLRSAKVVLDTYPYGGCLTSHDALVHHVPIVTLPSKYIRGRFTLGLYDNMNLTALTAHNATHFNTIVLNLLHNNTWWYEQAVQIQHKFTPLINTNNAKVAQEWADFFVRVATGN